MTAAPGVGAADRGVAAALDEAVVRSVPLAYAGPDDERDWRAIGDALVLEAFAQRLTGALVAAVEAGWARCTEDQVALLHQRHTAALTWCLRLEDRLCDVVEAFAGVGIDDVRVFKGPAIAHLDEADPSHRTFGDLDLLVRGDDLDRVVATLASMGAARPYPERRPGFDRRFAKSVTVTFPDGIEVDVHRTICDGVHSLRVPIDRLFEHPDRFVLAGVPVTAPDPTVRTLHAAYHAVLGSPEPRLMSRRDLLGAFGRSDRAVEPVVAEAERWRGTAVLHEAVRAARALPGVALPGWAAWADSVTIEPAEVSIVAGQRRDGSSYGPSRFRYLAELPGWRDRAAYGLGVLYPTRQHLAARGLRRTGLLRRR